MNKKVKITIAISAIALTVAGVIAAKSVFNKEAPILEYESVSDVIKNADNVIGTTYQNFSLPDSISIDASDQLYEIKADYSKNCDKKEKLNELAQLMIPDQEIKITEESNDCITGKSEKATIWYYDDSTFAYAREELTIPTNQLQNGKKYIVGKDSLDDKYVLNGEDYTIKEAVDYAESFANDKLMPFLVNDSGLKAESACAFKVDDENYWIYVQLEHYMYGCPVSTSGSAVMDEAYMRPQQLIITFDGKNEICHIENNYYSNITEKTKIDKIITLGSALKYLEKELAPGSNYTVSNISLSYCARIEDINNEIFEYRPMWCLTVGNSSPDNTNINPRTIIYIDAQNGNVCCFSDADMSFVF